MMLIGAVASVFTGRPEVQATTPAARETASASA
jgi:hypothetical protein